jgi:serine/threonine-protein kinase HipA
VVASTHGDWEVDADGRLARMHVFAEIDGGPSHAGVIEFERSRGSMRQGTFTYDTEWINRPGAASLFPTGLPLRKRVRSDLPNELPLPFYDSSPDGWGKTILQMAYPDIRMAFPEYIAAAGGDRIGHLQFGPDANGPSVWIPAVAMIDLPEEDDDLDGLYDAADAVEAGMPTRSHLAKLLKSGADIGGARPKARIRVDGEAWIVKFRASEDAFDHQRVEAACLSIAREAGIDTPDHRIDVIAERSALFVKRFDRQGSRRLAYSSAATIMGYPPGTYRPDGASYADLITMARRARIADCSREVFRRLLLNCFLNNTDDHLHNHGFIEDGAGWRISPLFDVVPQAGRALVLRPARGISAEANPKTVLLAFSQFRISQDEAEEDFAAVLGAARRIDDWLDHYGVRQRDREIVLRRIHPLVTQTDARDD